MKIAFIREPATPLVDFGSAGTDVVFDNRDAEAIEAAGEDRLDFVHLCDADEIKTRRLPRCFDPAEFTPMDRKLARCQLGLDVKAFIVLQVCDVVPREGIENVVRAMALLPRGIHPQLLVIGGDADPYEGLPTPEIDRLRGITRELEVEDIVTFAGCRPREQLRVYHAAADVFVSTPSYEPCVVKPLQAMACGTPVVGSAVSGIEYSVVDGLTGYLVAPNDPPMLAEHLLYLHAHPALARAFGVAGLRRVRAMASSEAPSRTTECELRA